MVSLNIKLRVGFFGKSEFQDFSMILTEINRNEIGIEIAGIQGFMVNGLLGVLVNKILHLNIIFNLFKTISNMTVQK